MDTNYTRIFTGDKIDAQRVVTRLREIDIISVVKDEAESARLSGFESSMLSGTEVFAHNDELEPG